LSSPKKPSKKWKKWDTQTTKRTQTTNPPPPRSSLVLSLLLPLPPPFSLLPVVVSQETLKKMEEMGHTDYEEDSDHKSMLIEWNSSLSVGVKKFDRDHMKLVNAINELWKAKSCSDVGKKREVLGM
jgi:hypothetical protein